MEIDPAVDLNALLRKAINDIKQLSYAGMAGLRQVMQAIKFVHLYLLMRLMVQLAAHYLEQERPPTPLGRSYRSLQRFFKLLSHTDENSAASGYVIFPDLNAALHERKVPPA